MSDRRVLAVSAACITAAIFLFLLGTYPSWKAAIGGGLSWRGDAPSVADLPGASDPAARGAQVQPEAAARPDVGQTVAPVSAARLTPPPVPAAPLSPAPVPQSADAPSPTPSSPAIGNAPSFDVVRVEPNGDSVVAARATAGATVTLLDQGRPIAQAQADSGGQVAFVPPTLAPGDHSLMLSVGTANTPGSLSSQSVAVSVPAQAKAAPMVALLQPDRPTRVLSSPAPTAASGATAPAPPVSVGAIDVEEMGSVFATGHAAPGSQCRVYLNGSFVANVTAGKDGTWSLKIERGMKPGHYSVRVDQVASAAGEVQARAEVPFDYPARAATSVSLLRPRKGATALPVGTAAPAASPAKPAEAVSGSAPATMERDAVRAPADRTAVASAGSAGAVPAAIPAEGGVPTVVSQLLTTKVVHGDSLWRISRKVLGHGRRYTQIYAANTTQIRNPRLIYPGQIFVLPQDAP